MAEDKNQQDLADVPPPSDVRRYWCFISYRHADNKQPGRQWANWLHQAIETYDVPPDLIGTINARGDTIPERIFPVFRDEEELPADADLASPIYQALDRSKFLVVLCSPRAAKSPYVSSEIAYFKKIGRSGCILAAIIDGEPNASDHPDKGTSAPECFPDALRLEVDAHGHLTNRRAEPIAPDFRLNDGSEGWTTPQAYRLALEGRKDLNRRQIADLVEAYKQRQHLMLLKILAGIMALPVGVLTKRDHAYQLQLARKRQRTLVKWLAGLSTLLLIALVATFFAISNNLSTKRSLSHADTLAAEGLLAQNNTPDAMAYLARAIKNDPDNRVAFLHAVFQLLQNRWVFLARPPLRHSTEILSANFLGETHDVVTLASDGRARLFRANSSEPQIIGPPGLTKMVPSPSGDQIVTADRESIVRIFDVKSGQQISRDLQCSAPVESIVFNKTGTLFLVNAHINLGLNGDRTNYYFYFGSVAESAFVREALVLSGDEADLDLNALVYDDEANAIFYADEWGLHKIDLNTGKVEDVSGSSLDSNRYASVSPDQSEIAVGGNYSTSGADPGYWSILSIPERKRPVGEAEETPATQEEENAFDGTDSDLPEIGKTANVFAFSSGCSIVAVGYTDGRLSIWAGDRISEFLRLGTFINKLSFSPDDKLLCGVTDDGLVRIWKADDWMDQALHKAISSSWKSPFIPEFAAFRVGNGILDCKFSRDSTKLLTACKGGELFIWDLTSLSAKGLIQKENYWERSLKNGFIEGYPDKAGKQIILSKDERYEYEVLGGIDTYIAIRDRVTGRNMVPGDAYIAWLSENGKTLGYKRDGGFFECIAMPSGQLLISLATESSGDGLDLSGDGSRLVVCDDAGEMRVWSLLTGLPLSFAFGKDEPDLSFHPFFIANGRCILRERMPHGSGWGSADLWNAETGAIIARELEQISSVDVRSLLTQSARSYDYLPMLISQITRTTLSPAGLNVADPNTDSIKPLPSKKDSARLNSALERLTTSKNR